MPRREGSRLPQTVRTSAEVAEVVPELTRRQLEYWVEMGWVRSAEPPSRGHPRTFSDTEKRILGTMYRLVEAGFPARNAAWIAREAVKLAERHPESAVVRVRAAAGVWVEIIDLPD